MFTTSPYFSQVFDTINPLIKIAKIGDSSLNLSQKAIEKIESDLEILLFDLTSSKSIKEDDVNQKSTEQTVSRVNPLFNLKN